MGSRESVKKIKVSDDRNDGVVFEGILGKLRRMGVVDGALLEIEGTDAVLRIDLTEDEIRRHLFKGTSRSETGRKRI
jgi:hypothetical protein